MKTKTQNHLPPFHLYVGSEAGVAVLKEDYCADFPLRMQGIEIMPLGPVLKVRDTALVMDHEVNVIHSKLILRPLSDITVEELVEVYKIINSENWEHHDPKTFAADAKLHIFNGKSLEPRLSYPVKVTAFLIECGFDLGLIPEKHLILKPKQKASA